MPALKQKALVNSEPSKEIFVISLNKKMASYLQTLLPERCALQLKIGKLKKSQANISFRLTKQLQTKFQHQDHSPDEVRSECESIENYGQNGIFAKKVQNSDISTKSIRTLGSEKKEPQKQQKKQESLLSAAIQKFLENCVKLNQIKQILEKPLMKIRQNLEANYYKNFLAFKLEFQNLVKLLKQKKVHGKAVNSFKQVFANIEYFYSRLQSSSQENAELEQANEVVNYEETPKAQKVQVKKSKAKKQSKKCTQKELSRAKVNIKTTELPQGLFEVAQESQNETNSQVIIDATETATIYTLLNRLHKYDQETLINSIKSKKGEPQRIRDLNRQQAADFVAKIKNMLKKSNFQLQADEKTESSFQIESDAE